MIDEAHVKRVAYGVAARLLYTLAVLFLVLPWILEQPVLLLFHALNMTAPGGIPSNVGKALLALDLVFVTALALTATVAAVLARQPPSRSVEEDEATA